MLFTLEAIVDFEDVKGKQDRKATFNAVHKLAAVGPDLPSPHMKSLKGAPGLCELRPRQGRSAVRPIYVRTESRFIVLAVAKDKDDFDAALERAKVRRASVLG